MTCAGFPISQHPQVFTSSPTPSEWAEIEKRKEAEKRKQKAEKRDE